MEVQHGFERGIRKIKFKFELYSGKGEFKKDLSNILSFKISHNYFAQVKTTAKITLKEDPEIDYINDVIRPKVLISYYNEPEVKDTREVVFLNMTQPVETEVIVEGEYGDWEEYSLGHFFLSSPKREDKINSVIREIEAYDVSLILAEDRITERLVIREGANYVEEISKIIRNAGVRRFFIESTEEIKTKRTIEYEPGTSLLTIINDLLGQIGNTPLYMDNIGVLNSYKYVNPADREPTISYRGEDNLVVVGAEEELDIFNVPNVFTVAISNPDEEPITKTVVNDDPTNPLSTVRRGRRIVDFRTIEDMSNESSLEKYVIRIANEANTQYGSIKFKTPIVLGHWYSEVIDLEYAPLGIDGTYLESGWEMDLKVGGEMIHTLRKVVRFSESELE